MDAFTFISRIRQAGFTIGLTDGNLAISPASSLTDKRRAWIRAHKDELVAALQAPASILDAACGHDLAPANCPLPARLALAAERVCREVHGDSDDQVQEMLDDLASYPSDDWDSLADHFEGQLPPPPEEGRERITLMDDNRQFQMDVPVEHVAEFSARASVRFRLKGNGGGGAVLGSPGTPREELVADLHTRYGKRLASIDGAEVSDGNLEREEPNGMTGLMQSDCDAGKTLRRILAKQGAGKELDIEDRLFLSAVEIRGRAQPKVSDAIDGEFAEVTP